jgi:hypothetical protein
MLQIKATWNLMQNYCYVKVDEIFLLFVMQGTTIIKIVNLTYFGLPEIKFHNSL